MIKLLIISFVIYISFLTLATFPVLGQQPTETGGNSESLRQFGEKVIEKIEKNKIDLDTPFLIEITSTTTRDGRLDPTSTKLVRQEGDAQLAEIVSEAVGILGESGYFAPIRNFGIENIRIVIKQTTETVSATLEGELPTDARARNVANTIELMFSVVKRSANDVELSDERKQEIYLINNSKAVAAGKNVTLMFEAPAQSINEMIITELEKLRNSKPKSK